jgi:hypothetical protein
MVASIPSQQETADVVTSETATGEELSAAQNSAFEETENHGEFPFEMVFVFVVCKKNSNLPIAIKFMFENS